MGQTWFFCKKCGNVVYTYYYVSGFATIDGKTCPLCREWEPDELPIVVGCEQGGTCERCYSPFCSISKTALATRRWMRARG